MPEPNIRHHGADRRGRDTPDSDVKLVVARTEAELVQAVSAADQAGIPVHLVGGAGTPGTPVPGGPGSGRVIRVATHGISVNDDGCSIDSLSFCGAVMVTVAAGESWDGFVALAVDSNWVGIECLAGASGSVGEATVANIRAYGQSVADTVAFVRTWDRARSVHRRFAMVDCGFDDEGSRFSRERMPDGSQRYVLLDVGFLFRQGSLSAPIEDPSLCGLIGLPDRQRAPLAQIRNAVLQDRSKVSRPPG